MKHAPATVGDDVLMTTSQATRPTPITETEPQWLSAPELDAWMGLIRLVVQLPAALDRQLREEAGMNHGYYQILAVLSDAPGRAMRMSELARLTGTSQSRLSHAVASLEQRGWVARRPCPDDGRGQVAHLTDAGMGVLVASAPGHVAEVRRLVFDQLDQADVRQLSAITAKVLRRLDPAAG
jgi:DNA-binding MarR family transcriptional regulator